MRSYTEECKLCKWRDNCYERAWREDKNIDEICWNFEFAKEVKCSNCKHYAHNDLILHKEYCDLVQDLVARDYYCTGFDMREDVRAIVEELRLGDGYYN